MLSITKSAFGTIVGCMVGLTDACGVVVIVCVGLGSGLFDGRGVVKVVGLGVIFGIIGVGVVVGFIVGWIEGIVVGCGELLGVGFMRGVAVG